MALHITYQKASVTVVEIAITTHANFRHQEDRASVKHYSNAVHYEALYHDLYCAGGYVTEEAPGTA